MASNKHAELSSEGVAAFSPEPKGGAVSTWTPPAVIDDRFHGVRPLGWGGMGHVYRAWDAELGREVALKFIREPDALSKARFMREAEATAKLQDQNVVTVYDRGQVEGHLYIVMELLSGKSLYDAPRPMPWPEVLRLGVELSSGLAAAHAKRVLHRDIKLGNVMLTDDGKVKLIDFGLAKLERSSTPSAPPEQECTAAETLRAGTLEGAPADEGRPARPKGEPCRRLTDTGIMVGTAGYRAPECWGGEATPRSDVYSCGAVFFELCTGRAVYPNLTSCSLWIAVRDRDAPLVTELEPDVHPQLAEIIARCLSRDPGARYASGRELHEALRGLRDRVSAGRSLAGSIKSFQAIDAVKTMAWREIDRLMVSVISAETPTNEEWLMYLEDCQRKAATGPLNVLVVTAGGGPTRQQRMALRDLVANRPVPAAVVSDATNVHNIVTELRWRNPGLIEFRNLDDALEYLDIHGSMAVHVLRHVSEMQREVA